MTLPTKFLAALKHYLEADPHGTKTPLSEMAPFVKSLTDEDRAAFRHELTAAGYELVD